jgi:hypothetical protein
MSEAIPIPVIEVRETFTPSEPLRDVLAGLLDPNLSPDQHTSLRASFLFKSYRRRLIDLTKYYHKVTPRFDSEERPVEIAHIVRDAAVDFRKLSLLRIGLANPLLQYTPPENSKERIIFVAKEDQSSVESINNVLSGIPTIEQEKPMIIGGNLFYIEVAKNALLHDITSGVYSMGELLGNEQNPNKYSIEPVELVKRSTTLLKRQPPEAA